jgi:DeoR family transcriptional regulator, suf operon transcriptional repressor
MKSTREKVLEALSVHPRSTIVDVAKYVGINAISVRHHLTHLQADGLVSADEERHGIGRPHLVYLLTENGMEHFPTSYIRLTGNLLDHLKHSLNQEKLNEIFKSMAENLSSEYKVDLDHLNMEQKLELLTQVMAKEGFDIQWQRNGDHYEIREISCPFYQVGKRHPEVCLFDRSLIANILSIPIEKIQTQHMTNSLCSFVINK